MGERVGPVAWGECLLRSSLARRAEAGGRGGERRGGLRGATRNKAANCHGHALGRSLADTKDGHERCIPNCQPAAS